MLAQSWREVQASIVACQAVCVAVSKRQSLDKIQACYALGQRDFGENYVQEGVAKIGALSDLDITWHFLGAIQSNKTKLLATHFDWVQSLDRLDIAAKLNRHCEALNKYLNICVAINVDKESQKSGIDVSELPNFLLACREYKFLNVRGIMVLPKPRYNEIEQRDVFNMVKALYDQLNQQGFTLDTLSMGMSNDYKVALTCGSNMVRVGAKLFGVRKPK